MKYKIDESMQVQTVLSPGKGESEWLGLDHLNLPAGAEWETTLGDEEAVLVLLSGQGDVSVGSQKWEKIGQRASIFAAPPTAVYAPKGARIGVKAGGALRAALCRAPVDNERKPVLISPEDVRVVNSGAANWRRDVRLVVPPGSPISERLIIGETLNPTGNWSGVPPHKHDTVSDVENRLEEFYLFQAQPADGYGVQLVYNDKKKDAQIVEHNDVAFYGEGYHPTVAAPGVAVCYLWALAGEKKDYLIRIDPRFGWVASTENVLREMKNE